LAYEYENIFEVEHGPYGGDEINIISRGMNYGWNKYSYGYDDIRGVVLDKYEPSYVEPLYYFLPAIGISDVSGCPFNTGNLSFAYKPCLVVSSLRGQSLHIVKFNKRLTSDNKLTPGILPSVINIENISIGERVRHIRSGNMEIAVFTDLLNIYTIKFNSNSFK
jgi:glucose/arabinose dehydrogenase